MHEPSSHLYFSQRLRLHYVDWGSPSAPNMLMIHGGRDLLDCCMTSEGGAAFIVTSRERAHDLPVKPIYILGGGLECVNMGYTFPADWSLCSELGAHAADLAFRQAEIERCDVDLCEIYDPHPTKSFVNWRHLAFVNLAKVVHLLKMAIRVSTEATLSALMAERWHSVTRVPPRYYKRLFPGYSNSKDAPDRTRSKMHE